MKTKFVLPEHTNPYGQRCGNTVRITWKRIGGKNVSKCAVCEKQLTPLTFKEVLASHRFPIDGTLPRGPVGLVSEPLDVFSQIRKSNIDFKAYIKGNYSKGCGNGTICGKCWKCS